MLLLTLILLVFVPMILSVVFDDGSDDEDIF